MIWTLLLLLPIVTSVKTPSLEEISQLKNDELDEIFKSSATVTTEEPEDLPTMKPSSHRSKASINAPDFTGPNPSQPTFSGTYPKNEVPINHAHALGPQSPEGPPRMMPDNSLNQLAETGANVLATGAHAFYRGAASVGQAFGIPQGNYQVPLFNQAAQFFGR